MLAKFTIYSTDAWRRNEMKKSKRGSSKYKCERSAWSQSFYALQPILDLHTLLFQNDGSSQSFIQ